MNIPAAIAVFALHAILLAPLPGCHQPPPPPPVAQARLVVDDSTRFARSGDGDLACEDSYRGVGFRLNVIDAVMDVAPGSPAERAGMRVGDNVLNEPIFGGNRHPLGTTLVAKVERMGQTLELPMVTGNICIESRRPK